MILAAFLLITAFFTLYILSPFFEAAFRKKRLEEGGRERDQLMQRKEEVLEALRDLEYDFKMKKVSEKDYSQLKEKLSREAVELMKQLDSMEGIVRENTLSFAANQRKFRKKARH